MSSTDNSVHTPNTPSVSDTPISSKILVGYVLAKDVKRSTSNKPEERQRKIIEAIQKETRFDTEESQFKEINETFSHVLTEVHDPQYVNFIRNAYKSFKSDMSSGMTADHEYVQRKSINEDEKNQGSDDIGLIPNVTLTLHQAKHIDIEKLKQNIPLWKHVSFYCTDFMCPIFQHTTHDIMMSGYNTYRMANALANGATKDTYKCVYSVTSNPGHHAGRDFFGGYCFLNNAMIAAHTLLSESTKDKVCILDLDFHAGDGTNDIVSYMGSKDEFKQRIRAISLHMNPYYDYPNYRGFESENTESVTNIVFEPDCESEQYFSRLHKAIQMIKEFQPKYLVLPFGADTYYQDPEVVSRCNLTLEDYESMGQLIGQLCSELGIKLFMTQEGGYCVEDIGKIMVCLLNGINTTI